MKKISKIEHLIIELLTKYPDGLSNTQIINMLDIPKGSISSRLTEMVLFGQVERVRHGFYRLPAHVATARPREMVETRTEFHDIPGYMRNQSPRNVTMYSITRLADVMQMKLRNGVKQMTVPLIGETIRIHIGNEVQSWPFSEAFTGYTEIEFRFSNGKSSIIAVASDDVITVALEPKSEGGKNA